MGLRGEEGDRERERLGLRITDHNKAGHFCVASSEILWALMGKRWREVKGRGSYLGRGNRVEGESCAG